MTNVIVLFPKKEDAITVRNLLVRYGYAVQAVCTSGAQALQNAEALEDGVIVCGYRYHDMMYSQLHVLLPEYFDMLLVAPQNLWSECSDNGIVCVTLPPKVQDLINTLEFLVKKSEIRRKKKKSKPVIRSSKDKKLIDEAKKILIERNNMSEEEAHRYIQKCSMDSGTNMTETAEMILEMM